MAIIGWLLFGRTLSSYIKKLSCDVANKLHDAFVQMQWHG